MVEIGRIPVDTPNDQLLVAAHAAFIFDEPELPDGTPWSVTASTW